MRWKWGAKKGLVFFEETYITRKKNTTQIRSRPEFEEISLRQGRQTLHVRTREYPEILTQDLWS